MADVTMLSITRAVRISFVIKPMEYPENAAARVVESWGTLVTATMLLSYFV